MDNLALGLNPAPTPLRPLLGLTILVVEDSRYACEALRLMCLRSGARIRRADSLASARRHLGVYLPCVVLIDLGLPDGAGTDLIAELAAIPNPPVILATSADDFAEPVAIAAGAHGFLPKPHDSLSAFQECILGHLPAERQPGGPRLINQEHIEADQISYRDDLALAAELLRRGPTPESLSYAAAFLSGIARQAHDDTLAMAAARLGGSTPNSPEVEQTACLLVDRIVETPVM